MLRQDEFNHLLPVLLEVGDADLMGADTIGTESLHAEVVNEPIHS